MESSHALKLNKVVLFKVGVGSFQKGGFIELNNTKTLKLSFKDSVMNDLLKTFSILKVSGDLIVSGVSYEAKDSNKTKLLEDSLINLPSEKAYQALVKQLRGIFIRIDHGNKKIEGKVLGTQIFEDAPTGQAIVKRDYVILLLENGEIKPIPIAEINGLEILDSTVDKDLKYFLETIIGQNKEKNKTVTIFFEGKEKSEFILNFLQETPAWKTSYRFYLSDADLAKTKTDGKAEGKEGAKSSKKALLNESKKSLLLQGWAIVDNPLDEDWENVDLTLVTGLPVSFVYDSYSPAWIVRPKIERKVETSAKPVQFEREMSSNFKKSKMPSGGMGGAPGGPPKPSASYASAPCPPAQMRAMAKEMAMPAEFAMTKLETCADTDSGEIILDEQKPADSFQASSEAEGGRGVAFKYHIKTPVFVKRNNSSLIPILQTQIEAFKISVYNKLVNPKFPLLTIEFENNSGLTLEEGPVSIFFNNAFAGEAMMAFLEQNAKGRLPYAVDQAIEIVESDEENTSNYHKVDIKDIIYLKYYRTKTITYKIKNFSDEKRVIIIEHPKIRGFDLFETIEPDEETVSCYRFIISLDNKENKSLIIKERKIDTNSEQADYISYELVEEWFKTKLIGEVERDFLIKRIDFRQKIQNLNNQKNTFLQQKTNLFGEQDRLRENLRSLKGSNSAEQQLRDKYIQKMEEQETMLELIHKKLEEITLQLIELEKNLTQLTSAWMNRVKK